MRLRLHESCNGDDSAAQNNHSDDDVDLMEVPQRRTDNGEGEQKAEKERQRFERLSVEAGVADLAEVRQLSTECCDGEEKQRLSMSGGADASTAREGAHGQGCQ